MKTLKRTPWTFLITLFLVTGGLMAAMVGDLATSPAWAQSPPVSPVRADVLWQNDGVVHLGTLKSFDGTFS